MQSATRAPSQFFSCDWGTTSFRLRYVQLATRAVLGEIAESGGVKTLNAGLSPSAPQLELARARHFSSYLATKLTQLVEHHSIREENLPIVISGMASSTVGWREVPYARTPFAVDGSDFRFEQLALEGGSWPVYLLSGLATASDVMRGEETEVVGLLGQSATDVRDALLVLPGTHSKHVRVRDGAIVDFQTYMTGELFELLATQSLLRVSVEWPLCLETEGSWTDSERNAFVEGVESARQWGLNRSLFRVRTRTVLDRVPNRVNSWFLSGLLIGAEWNELEVQNTEASIFLAASEKFRDAYICAAAHVGLRERVTAVPAQQIAQAPVVAHACFLERLAKS